jgi:hypothetical protein
MKPTTKKEQTMNAKTKIAKLMNAALATAVVYEDGSAAATVYEQNVFGYAEHKGFQSMNAALADVGFTYDGTIWTKVSADRSKQAVMRLHDPQGSKGKGWICCIEIAPAGQSF